MSKTIITDIVLNILFQNQNQRQSTNTKKNPHLTLTVIKITKKYEYMMYQER